jgi:hypothetical protein
VAVTFAVAGSTYTIADPQATILAENLRILIFLVPAAVLVALVGLLVLAIVPP